MTTAKRHLLFVSGTSAQVPKCRTTKKNFFRRLRNRALLLKLLWEPPLSMIQNSCIAFEEVRLSMKSWPKYFHRKEKHSDCVLHTCIYHFFSKKSLDNRPYSRRRCPFWTNSCLRNNKKICFSFLAYSRQIFFCRSGLSNLNPYFPPRTVRKTGLIISANENGVIV